MQTCDLYQLRQEGFPNTIYDYSTKIHIQLKINFNMAISFFNSWQLWEKMTFVLGCAIVAVFCVGYIKLLWTNRIVARQEILDEEKRIKIQELRQSGQFVETSKDSDVPFGVRAIQSGIQVDGIWISGTNTPVPSIKLHRHSSYEPSTPDSTSNAHASPDGYNHPTPPKNGQPNFRCSESAILPSHRSVSDDDTIASDPRSSSRQRATYKPTRSSQLRFGTVGEHQYDEETLEHLEGNAETGRVYTHRPRGARQSDESISDAAAAADNERSSGTSDESDETFSRVKHPQPNRPFNYPTRTPSPEVLTPAFPSFSHQPTTKGKGQYSSIPLFPEDEESNPFSSGHISTYGSNRQPVEDQRYTDNNIESRAPLLKTRSPSSQFIPGELHQNKLVRKVNSGFEILPAGTFGTQPTLDLKGKAVNRHEGWNVNNLDHVAPLHPNKLQKKTRFSMISLPSRRTMG
ncbi:0eb092ce-9d13-44e1-a718-21f45db657f0 [Sclerotinia trifoliorum]|uniref:0eb092ce-9d13-44e1-a718-21f45db657f0 n=1 Tax=Sclerotinia trifoliorum TaxID=28548 RepID=A0A8H2ZQA3_9HELO|nr:0eb092ce-9d13-44e1-a718-21f45db657f0 [Sclerotinia trifoliorum]